MSHIIPPFSSTFIGIDSSETSATNNNNNNLQNLMNGSRFYLSQFENSNNLIQLITNYFQQITTKNTQWSRPVKIDSQLEDVFLPIPGIKKLCETLGVNRKFSG
jgi:hypothetical protein